MKRVARIAFMNLLPPNTYALLKHASDLALLLEQGNLMCALSNGYL